MFWLRMIVTVTIVIQPSGISSEPHVNLTSQSGRCVRVGQRLVLNCSLQGNTSNFSQLYIKKGTTRVRSSKRFLVRETKAESSLIIPETTFDDQGTYICCKDLCSSQGEFDSGMFEVGYIPHDPLYFHCIISHVVICYFTTHDSCVDWTLQYHLSGESDVYFRNNCSINIPKSARCVDFNDNDHSYRNLWRTCSVKSNDDVKTTCPLTNAVRDATYRIHVEGRGPFGMSSFEYNITTNITIERLGSLRGFRVQSTTSRTATLNWDFPNNSAYYNDGISCNITSMNGNTTQRETKLWKKGKVVQYILQNLRPYRNYSIRVQCRFSASKYWSRSNDVTCTTKQDAPMYGPEATSTSYSIYQSPNKTLTVAMYVKPPDMDTINGVLEGYELQLFSSMNVSTPLLTKRYAVLSTLILENIPADKGAIHADISSLTVIGRSRHSLRINISTDETTNTDAFHVEVVSVNEYPDHSHFLVGIKHSTLIPPVERTVTYIYHWCQENTIDYDCKDRKVVKCADNYDFVYSNQTQRTIILNKLSPMNYSWVFGASIASSTAGEGIQWEKCTLPYGWSNNSTTNSIDIIDRQLALLALPLCILIPMGIFYIWRRYRHGCTAYDIDLPDIDRCPDVLDDKLKVENEDNEEEKNPEYSRLHSVGIAQSKEGNDTSSDQEMHYLVGFQKNINNVKEITSFGNDDIESDTEERGVTSSVDQTFEFNDCRLFGQRQEGKRHYLSNYVQNIPGDAARAFETVTFDETTGNTNSYGWLAEVKFPDINTECAASHATRLSLIPITSDDEPDDKLKAGNEDNERVGNPEYSRLRYVSNSQSEEGDRTSPDQEMHQLVSFQKNIKNEKEEITSWENDGFETDGEERGVTSSVDQTFEFNDCRVFGQRQEGKRHYLSNYVKNIPGDAARSSETVTFDETTGNANSYGWLAEVKFPDINTALEDEDDIQPFSMKMQTGEMIRNTGYSCLNQSDSTCCEVNTMISNQEFVDTDEDKDIAEGKEDGISLACTLDEIANKFETENAETKTSPRKTDENTGKHETKVDGNETICICELSKDLSDSEFCQEKYPKKKMVIKRKNSSNYVACVPGDTAQSSDQTIHRREHHEIYFSYKQSF